MKKFISTIFIIICLPVTTLAQNNSSKAKAHFFTAQKSFEKRQYNSALEKLDEVVELLGSSNARVEMLRIKCYYEKGSYREAKTSLNKFFSYDADESLIKEVSPYLDKIDAKLDAEKRAEEKRKTDAILAAKKEKMEQERIKLATIKLDSIVREQLNFWNRVNDGVFYELRQVKGITKSSREKAYISIMDDKFILYTIPSPNVKYLVKSNFRTNDLPRGYKRYGTLHSARMQEKYRVKNKFSDKFNPSGFATDQYYGLNGNIFIFGLHTNAKLRSPLYAWLYGHVPQIDHDVLSTFDDYVFNPYVEIGTVELSYDYTYATDDTKTMLKAAGVKNIKSGRDGPPKGITMQIRHKNDIIMLGTIKHVTWEVDDRNIELDKHSANGITTMKSALFVSTEKEKKYLMVRYKANHGDFQLQLAIPKENNNHIKFDEDKFSICYAVMTEMLKGYSHEKAELDPRVDYIMEDIMKLL